MIDVIVIVAVLIAVFLLYYLPALKYPNPYSEIDPDEFGDRGNGVQL